ncbi:MAG: HzsA-related protein [Pirellulaceae bacterium]
MQMMTIVQRRVCFVLPARCLSLLWCAMLLVCSGPLVAEELSPVTDGAAEFSASRVAGTSAVEEDWIRQAEAIDAVRRGVPHGPAVSTQSDAAGAVDGIKDGKYAFHTNQEPNPWWQVDLGQTELLARLVVYNRLDYAPGLHNADTLIVLTSDDGRQWTRRYDNQGKHFGGISGAKPLEVPFAPGEVQARYVRLQIPSAQPIFLHLDEVEIYGSADPARNLALRKPADQSSLSVWSTSKLPPREGSGPVPLSTAEVLARGRLLAGDLRKSGLDTTPFDRQIDAVAARLAGTSEQTSYDELRRLYFEARRVVRALAFTNPLVQFDQLLFVKRFTQQTYPDICLNHMPWVSRPGGDLCVLSHPFSPEDAPPQVRQILNGQLGPGHVHGMDLWWDADRIVFGYARKPSLDPPLQPWPPAFCACRNNVHEGLRKTIEPTHIFEIGVDGSGLRQLTDHHYWSDLDPTYLPDGQIAFVSERCAYSLQCNHDPSLDETSCNLYAMRPDGSGIRRLSVNKDGDYLPHCLDDGTIGYTRWEYHERNLTQIQSLWFIRPDGTWADALFKQHLNDPWALEDVRSIPGSRQRQFVAIAAGHHTLAAGPIVIISAAAGLNNPAGIRIVTPGVTPPEGGMSGTPVTEGGVCDDGGHYMSPWPLSDKFFLASYSYSNAWPQGFPEHYRGMDEKGYALYLIDVFGNKELIYRDPEISCFMPMPLQSRPRPLILPDTTDPSEPYGVCTLSDAAFGCEGLDPRQVRYLRIAHPVAWPYDEQSGGLRYERVALSEGVNWTPVEVLGTVPVEADGSAHFRVPVDKSVYFQLLDEHHMELRRMRSFISFQPGERRGCVGCHESKAVAPTSTPELLALQRDASIPTPPPWGVRPLNFLRDIQPVFERHCVRCHGGLKPAGDLDFSGGLTTGLRFKTLYGGELSLDGHNTAYRTLITQGLVAYSNKSDPADVLSQPLQFGSHRSKLIAALHDGPCGQRVQLTADDWLRLVTWVDANAPYHSHFLNTRLEKQPYDLPADQQLLAAIGEVHSRRCTPCHTSEEVTRADWIDLGQPKRSLFLAAPLATASTGRRCAHPPYADQQDADYQVVCQLVDDAVKKAWSAPRRDLEGLLPDRAATQLPRLAFESSPLDETLGEAYRQALHNLLEINTVAADMQKYNRTGLLTGDPPKLIRAGGDYQDPWTRDASVNSWNAASLLAPMIARNTLWAVCERLPNDRLIIQRDNQWWDKLIWVTAAWNHFVTTGDREFLMAAYEATAESLAEMSQTRFDREYGLYQGPSHLADGIAGYPAPFDDPKGSSSFILDHPGSESMMTLSANCIAYHALCCAARMAKALHAEADVIEAWRGQADALKTAIERQFWIPSKNSYAYFLHGSGALRGTPADFQEATGVSLAVLLGVADSERAQKLVEQARTTDFGIALVEPEIPRYSAEQPSRHGRMVWPMAQGYWASAAARTGNVGRFQQEVESLASLAKNSGWNFREIYHPASGAPDGGWQSGIHWDSCSHQTWSATAYLRMIHDGMCGMAFEPEGLRLAPTLPAAWGPVALTGISYRDMMLDVHLAGRGRRVVSVVMDGVHVDAPFVPCDLRGSHRLEITLDE